MPLYEYQCKKCDSLVEILVRRDDESPECPECGSQKLEKQLSVAAAPAVSGAKLPVCAPSETPTCGRPQCGSGCMFE